MALLAVLDDRVRRQTFPLVGSVLQVHARYTLDEILAAFDEQNSKGGVKRIQTGVYHCKEVDTDLLLDATRDRLAAWCPRPPTSPGAFTLEAGSGPPATEESERVAMGPP